MSKREDEIQAPWSEPEGLPQEAPAVVAGDPVWQALMSAPAQVRLEALPSLVFAELLALADGGYTALVRYPGQSTTAALPARSVVDLHGAHIGKTVTLAFEGGDAGKPVVTGVLREPGGWPLADEPAQVEVDVDGQRMLVSAREELVLRCGRASITLTKAGRVLIQGSYVSSRSTGVNRLKGGTVQLN